MHVHVHQKMKYPAACCRECGAAVCALDDLGVLRLEGSHLTADEPAPTDPVTLKPHHKAGLNSHQHVDKIHKVNCRVCGYNLGNVQSWETTDKIWCLKTLNVGFRRSAEDDKSVVCASIPSYFGRLVMELESEGDFDDQTVFDRLLALPMRLTHRAKAAMKAKETIATAEAAADHLEELANLSLNMRKLLREQQA
jgi:hypothetical protein